MSKPVSDRRGARCPLCGKPAVDAESVPFCSPLCRDRDLLKWFGEGYRLPGRPATEEGDDTGLS